MSVSVRARTAVQAARQDTCSYPLGSGLMPGLVCAITVGAACQPQVVGWFATGASAWVQAVAAEHPLMSVLLHKHQICAMLSCSQFLSQC